MPQSGFLVLLYQHLVTTFSSDQVLRDKDWLFYNAGAKIFVHGHERTVSDTNIIAEITSDPAGKSVCLKIKGSGTVPDRKLLAKYIQEKAPNAKIKYQNEESHVS